ncbi:hypothetical protein DYB37_013461 [Aphanomyces astaci]|uniref:Transmembrane protein n=1 Tax=Aphanomyces astaci TaxID=112090 RepID=A0A3L6VSN1_APHAT|nr:hypothetical protein DYB35_013370 [Aphanomyces astaci]RHZ09575.1 hypothetical protein DYB37_013461 [Aphanomyces astaci]RLO11837.1 hypothetical protein DYB28_006016 [Aphanomyces astaci]
MTLKPTTTAQTQDKTAASTLDAPTTTLTLTTTVVESVDAASSSSSMSTPIAFAVGGAAFFCLAVFAAKKFRSRQHDDDSAEEYAHQPSTKPASSEPIASDFVVFSTPVVLAKTNGDVLPPSVTRESHHGNRTSIEFEIHAVPSPMQDNQFSFGGDLWDEVEKINSQRELAERTS